MKQPNRTTKKLSSRRKPSESLKKWNEVEKYRQWCDDHFVQDITPHMRAKGCATNQEYQNFLLMDAIQHLAYKLLSAENLSYFAELQVNFERSLTLRGVSQLKKAV